MSTGCPICGASTRPTAKRLYDDRYGYPGQFAILECDRCGHRHLDAVFSPEELTGLYSEYYPRGSRSLDDFTPYTEVHGFGAWLDGEAASAFRWVPRGVRVLDIGCGSGETLAYHQARGCDALGVDLDENIERFAARYGLNARAGSFDPSDYEPESFDYVTLDQVLEHVADPKAFLAGVASVVRPGGSVILSTPNSRGLSAHVAGRRWINWHVPYHLQQFSRQSVAIAAESTGLTVESVRTLTNSAWLAYQWMHLLTFPPRGDASPFWAPSRSDRTIPREASASTSALRRFKVFQIATRIVDAAGGGDSFLCVLRKPLDGRN